MVPDGVGKGVQCLASLFYADDSLFASPRLARIQAALDVLMGIFDRVGLQTNIYKMVIMVFHPCYIVGGHLETAYIQRIICMG